MALDSDVSDSLSWFGRDGSASWYWFVFAPAASARVALSSSVIFAVCPSVFVAVCKLSFLISVAPDSSFVAAEAAISFSARSASFLSNSSFSLTNRLTFSSFPGSILCSKINNASKGFKLRMSSAE